MRCFALLLLLPGLVLADDLEKKIDRLAQPYVSHGIVVGLVVGVYDGESKRVFGYGHVKLGGTTVPDGNTVYEIGSITKVFTGILLASMVQSGEVRLEQPVSELVPEAVVPKHGDRIITLEHLSTHTSALPRMPSNFRPKDPSNPYADYTVEQMYEFLRMCTLSRDPGVQHAYSNLGAGLLGHALSLKAVQSYEALMIERVAGPLKMNSTRVEFTPEMRKRLAPGYTAALTPQSNWDIPTLAGAGAIRSTANDMLTFLVANLSGGDTPLAKAMAMAHQVHFQGKGPRMGLGWHIDNELRWHNGQTGGYHSFAGVHFPKKRAVVVVTNAGTGHVDQLARNVGNLLLGKPVKPHEWKQTVKIDAKILDSYAGDYQLTPQFVLTVTHEKGRLMVQATNQPKLPVFPESETKFFYRTVKARIVFQKDGHGKVTGLVLHQHGAEMPAKKIR